MSLSFIPATASDYVLTIFGNADMDDTIDEADVEYLKGIIEGTNDVTDLADANYDGEIDEDDITQIELIISNEEDELTLMDHADRIVTVSMPVERIVSANTGCLRSLVALGALDRIVGISSDTIVDANNLLVTRAHPEIEELPEIGMYRELNPESIVMLDPDVIFYAPWIAGATVNALQDRTSVPVICLGPYGNNLDGQKGCYDSWKLAGMVLGADTRADELINYCEEEIAEITDITSGLSEDEKPGVYYGGPLMGWVSTLYPPIEIAGGINVAKSVDGDGINIAVSKEQIIDWNPDVILLHRTRPDASIEEILSEPTLQTISAVKNGQVYYIMDGTSGYDIGYTFTMCIYLAKILHPDMFEDLDVADKCNEILRQFYGADDLYSLIEETGRGELYQLA